MNMRSIKLAALFCLSCLAIAAQAQEPVSDVEEPVVSVEDRVPLHTVVPKYPDEARRDRIEGEVEVCFNVNRKGRPTRIAVRSSSNRIFEKSAIRAVRASRYKPIPRSEPVPSIKTCRTFNFSLEKG